MRPSMLIKADAYPENDTIVVSGDTINTQIKLLGSSTKVSAPTNQWVSCFTVAPSKKGLGIVAIAVKTSDLVSLPRYREFFVSTSWAIDPTIELDKQWAPPASKLAQVYTDRIELEVKRQIFVTSKTFAGKEGYRVVNGNILCQYIIGLISYEELDKASTALVEKIDTKNKLAQLTKQLIETQAKLAAREAELEKIGQKIKQLEE